MGPFSKMKGNLKKILAKELLLSVSPNVWLHKIVITVYKFANEFNDILS